MQLVGVNKTHFHALTIPQYLIEMQNQSLPGRPPSLLPRSELLCDSRVETFDAVPALYSTILVELAAAAAAIAQGGLI